MSDQPATPDPGSGDPDADRPRPGPGTSGADRREADDSGDGADGDFTYGEDESQDFVDRSKIDFDPADGLYTGTAVEGESDIPGPSEHEIRKAQEELDDEQGNNAGEKAAAEKFIAEHDVDIEQAKQGEAIAGSAQSQQRTGEGADATDRAEE